MLDSVSDIGNSLRTKQDILISGTNIKTINGLSLLGEGNIVINGAGSTGGESTDLSNYYTKQEIDDKITDVSTYVFDNYYTIQEVDEFKDEIAVTTDYLRQAKQDKLVSGTNIKTINGQSLLGNGDIVINGGESTGGESTEHVNLTLKEYNNLSDEEKMNGKVYFIIDISYCLYSDYQNLQATVNALKNRVKVLENSIKST